MAKLTKKEQAWLDDLQDVLDRCPSKRLGFFTVGDPDIAVYDKKKQPEIDRLMDDIHRQCDFGPAVDKVGARLGSIDFPSNVHSTAG